MQQSCYVMILDTWRQWFNSGRNAHNFFVVHAYIHSRKLVSFSASWIASPLILSDSPIGCNHLQHSFSLDTWRSKQLNSVSLWYLIFYVFFPFYVLKKTGCQQGSCSGTSPCNNAAEGDASRFCAMYWRWSIGWGHVWSDNKGKGASFSLPSCWSVCLHCW